MASSNHINSVEAIERSDDLVLKILVLLPAKPLFKFKLVSKRWQSLISDPFISSSWRPQTSPSALIVQRLAWSSQDQCDNFSVFPLENEYTSGSRLLDFIKGNALTDMIEILSSCGGLILCCCHKPQIREYYVCNPSTKQFTIVPSLDRSDMRDLCLAFDPSKSPHYRILKVGLHYNEMYSSETNSWRRLPDPFPMSILSELRETTGVFFNGAIFWAFNSWCYFNMDTETLRYLDNPMPEMDFTYPYADYWLGCVNERLYFVGPADNGWIPHVSVFELGNDYLWSLEYRNDPLENWSSFLSVMAREDELFMAIYMHDRDQVILIKLIDNTCSMVLPMPLHASARIGAENKVYHFIENPFLAI